MKVKMVTQAIGLPVLLLCKQQGYLSSCSRPLLPPAGFARPYSLHPRLTCHLLRHRRRLTTNSCSNNCITNSSSNTCTIITGSSKTTFSSSSTRWPTPPWRRHRLTFSNGSLRRIRLLLSRPHSALHLAAKAPFFPTTMVHTMAPRHRKACAPRSLSWAILALSSTLHLPASLRHIFTQRCCTGCRPRQPQPVWETMDFGQEDKLCHHRRRSFLLLLYRRLPEALRL